MKRFIHKISVHSRGIALGAALCAVAGLSACGPKPVQDKILIAGSYWDTIAVVNRSAGNTIEWKYGLPKGAECNSVEIIPGTGDVLLSYKNGARVVKRDSVNGGGTIVWDYTDVAPGEELQTATRLPDGGYLLGICGTPARFVELDSTGLNVRREVRYDLGIGDAHSQFRRMVKARNGNYLVPIITNGKLLEIKDDTTLVAELNLGGNPFSVQELPNGNLLVGLGDAHCALEVDRSIGGLVRRIDAPAGVIFNFVGQAQLMPGGKVMVANWQGHAPADKRDTPQLVEVDLGKGTPLVWSYDGRKDGVRLVSAFFPFKE
ncbi:hypothetical protein [uncultured Rikenella sp.]|uniref:beta-propeller domain-containing protein n=1 Tax=uncultured Rikenella sp. TaxID=368003 RepID=UPI0026154F8F|nr:hypothetical protein [uncultured Rikenella sp.]